AGAGGVVYQPTALAPGAPALVDPCAAGGRGDAVAWACASPLAAGIGKGPVVLAYTRFVEFRPARLVDTYEGILRLVPDTYLLVVGRGLEGEEKEFQRLVEERGIGEQVVFAGWVPPDRLPAYFRAADLALYLLDDTLLNRTKCPMKLVELLAAGVPVVADRVGQAEEYVADGRTGILVPPGDSRAMAKAAVELLRDPARRAALAEVARAETRARWNWGVWAAEVERILGQRNHEDTKTERDRAVSR
ncbi:MAG: glycosyltransferase, partial [Sphingomonadaceae bacterium]